MWQIKINVTIDIDKDENDLMTSIKILKVRNSTSKNFSKEVIELLASSLLYTEESM